MTGSSEESRAGLIGLRNAGNTCYMNSVLQALSNCPPLAEFMRLSCSGMNDMRNMEKWQRKMVALEFGCLICLLWSDCSASAVTPTYLLESIRMSQPGFRIHQQQDAQEFLRFLLDKLHEAYKRPVFEWEARLLYQTALRMEPNLRRCDSDAESFVTCVSDSSLSSSESRNRSKTGDRLVNGCEDTSNNSEDDMDVDDAALLPTAVMTNGTVDSRIAENGVNSSAKQINVEGKTQNCRLAPAGLSGKPVRHTSIVSEVFGGRMLSSVQCLHCHRISETEECFQDLSLPIPSKAQLEELAQRLSSSDGSTAILESVNVGWLSWITSYLKEYVSGVNVTLNECLSLFFSPDRLTGEDRYHCEHCAKLREGVKVWHLLELPEVLCIHVKRFRYDTVSSRKMSNVVRFPLQGLDMSPFLHKNCVSRIATYDLVAVISHHGSVDGGHYTVHCFHNPSGQWHEFDDDLVTRVDPYVVENSEAYILFYQKTNDSMGPLRLEAKEMYERFIKFPRSTDAYYVSTSWLARFNSFAEPGPINNYDFLCRHGGVLMKLLPNNGGTSAQVSAELWTYLRDRFGGGPKCSKLERCPECEHFLYALNCRRHLELSLLAQVKHGWDCRASVGNGETDEPVYINLICLNWLKRWQEFILGNSNENCCCHIPSEAWKLFHRLYGGGPEVVIDCGSRRIVYPYFVGVLLRHLEMGGGLPYTDPAHQSGVHGRSVIIADPD